MFCFLFFFPPPHTTALAADAFPEVAPCYRRRPETENQKHEKNTKQPKKNKMKVLRRLCSAILWEVIIVE